MCRGVRARAATCNHMFVAYARSFLHRRLLFSIDKNMKCRDLTLAGWDKLPEHKHVHLNVIGKVQLM